VPLPCPASPWPAFPRPAAAPVYGPGGELEYIGDLSTGGALSYIHDVVYISSFVQLAGCLTDYAWLAFLLVRLRAGQGWARAGLACAGHQGSAGGWSALHRVACKTLMARHPGLPPLLLPLLLPLPAMPCRAAAPRAHKLCFKCREYGCMIAGPFLRCVCPGRQCAHPLLAAAKGAQRHARDW
jgi:hypothetical protein